MGYLNVGKMGLEGFTKYGKLLGEGKQNGMKVFEKKFPGKRVLTSVDQNDKVVKKVIQRSYVDSNIVECFENKAGINNFYAGLPKAAQQIVDAEKSHIASIQPKDVRMTRVINYKSGENVLHFYTPTHDYDRIVRADKNGAVESFVKKNAEHLDDSDRIFSSYNPQQNKYICARKPKGFKRLWVDSFQLNNGKLGEYGLKEGVSIPSNISRSPYGWPRESQDVFSGGGDYNLAEQVTNYFQNLLKGLAGDKIR